MRAVLPVMRLWQKLSHWQPPGVALFMSYSGFQPGPELKAEAQRKSVSDNIAS
jgi:hypothetical protein